MRSALTILLAGMLSAALTFLFIRWVERREIVAVENHRSMHTGRIPVGGGLPLILAALAVAWLLWPTLALPPAVLAALVALGIVSWRDDVKAVDPIVRLTVHLAASAAAVFTLPSDALVLHGWVPWVIDRAVAVLAVAWMINLTNFMDGIDGIAGSEVATVALGYAGIVAASASLGAPLYGLSIAIAGAALGFLLWNWSPARIFMGDVGSVPLGYLMAVLLLDLAVHHSLAAALILPLYFITDATLTLFKRVLAGERPWDAHRSHAYQRAAAALGSHAAVVKRIIVCNGVLMIAAVLAITAPWLGIAIAVAAIVALFASLESAARRTRVPSNLAI